MTITEPPELVRAFFEFLKDRSEKRFKLLCELVLGEKEFPIGTEVCVFRQRKEIEKTQPKVVAVATFLYPNNSQQLTLMSSGVWRSRDPGGKSSAGRLTRGRGLWQGGGTR